MTSSHQVDESAPSPLPGPTVTPTSRYFWDSTAEHRLMYQRCAECQAAVFPPRGHCPACWSTSLRWQESRGYGVIAAWAVVHRPGHPAFAPLAPYLLALVDLDEGFRLLSRVVDPDAENVPVGAAVQVTWEHSGDVTLPLFVAAPEGVDG